MCSLRTRYSPSGYGRRPISIGFYEVCVGKMHETYNVVGNGELDVVLLPDTPRIVLQGLGIARLAEQVLLDLEPVTATVVALDRSGGLAKVDLSRSRVLRIEAIVSKSIL
jgi:hypothetical protein